MPLAIQEVLHTYRHSVAYIV